jgi:hypothetical protein
MASVAEAGRLSQADQSRLIGIRFKGRRFGDVKEIIH